MYTTVIESLLKCTWVYIFLNWNKCVTRNESLPFSLLIVRRGNVFSIWTGTPWIGSNCLWTLDTLKFDGSIRVQFGQLCGARAIEEYWHHLAFLSSQWWPESSVSFDCQYVLQPPSAQGWHNCQDSSPHHQLSLYHCAFSCFYKIFAPTNITSQHLHQIYW